MNRTPRGSDGIERLKIFVRLAVEYTSTVDDECEQDN